MWLLISCVVIFVVSLAYTLARLIIRQLRLASHLGRAPRPVKPIDPSLRGAWHTSFWALEALPGGHDRCLFVHLCWCMAAGEIAKRTGGSYSLDCCLGGIAGMYVGFPVCFGVTRARLRAQHGIPGSLAADICLTAVCPCNYLAQALNQLDVADGVTAAAPRMPDIYRGQCRRAPPAAQPVARPASLPAGAPKGDGGSGGSEVGGVLKLAVRPASELPRVVV
jgi:Cys-rich protein (TIGR01571 family)